MSKDKGVKEKKKAPDPTARKGQSDYQAGKKSASGSESTFNKKGK
ncbi:MAG: hypothetical protein ACHQHN_08910 [Sphingobacteriales bacterium]